MIDQQQARELLAETTRIVDRLADVANGAVIEPPTAAEIVAHLIARNENGYLAAPEPYQLRAMLHAVAAALVPKKTYALPPRFFDDHRCRDLPENKSAVSRIVRETKKKVFVDLDPLGYDELLSDADYYANEMGSAGFDDRGLISSARATAAALRKAGRPDGEAVTAE